MVVLVELANMAVSADPGAVLVTHRLGGGIAFSVWDPETQVGGLLHFVLPEAKLASDKAKANPCMFGDTGIPRLLREAYDLGADKGRLRITVAGGAHLIEAPADLGFGKRNHLVAKKYCWKNKLRLDAEHVGGSAARTVKLRIGSGRVSVSIGEQETVL